MNTAKLVWGPFKSPQLRLKMFSVSEVAMRIVLEIFFFFLLVSASASKCPETRKPHVTSCVIFYNCINLPGGGYVWAPSRCAEGLVFQPTLRICVLPGDTWTCDDLLDRSSIADQTYPTSQLIDNTKSSYNKLVTDDMLYSFDISHKIDSSSNLGNALKTRPYPLIEIDEELRKNGNHGTYPDLSSASVQRLRNDLSNVNHGEEYIPVTLIKVKDEENDKIPDLQSFMNRIFFYQHFAPSLKQQTFVSSPYIDHAAVTSNERIDNNILNYLIENYMSNKKNSDSKPINPSGMIMKVQPTTEMPEMEPTQSNLISTSERNKIDVENIDAMNNVLAIIGNLGRKEYVTIEKYKSWPNGVNVEILEVIPCTRAHRLPNSTDCMRYYTCNPTSAEIHEFICPSSTAFNNQINLCDAQRYKSCRGKRNPMQSGKIQNTNKLQKIISTKELKDRETFPGVKLCETTGKFPDVSSDKLYYLCYSSKTSGKIESFRMACPNDLIFCPDKKVCTTKRLCSNFE